MEPENFNPLFSKVDVSQPTQIQEWVNVVAEKEGRIDVIISNVTSLSMADDALSWKSAFEVDLLGTTTLVNAALPHLESNKGSIIPILSVSGIDVDFTATSPYGACKAVVTHYTAQLARTLAPKGVRANTVSPGNFYIEDGVWGGIKTGNPELFESQLERTRWEEWDTQKRLPMPLCFLPARTPPS